MTEYNPDIKPYLKWAGGKRQLLSEIKRHIPVPADGYTYYEPFVGAGAVFFALRPEKALINDCNTQLILTYRVIKEDVEGLITILGGHKNHHDEQYYYEIRNLDRDTATFNRLSGAEKAARLIYLNKTCYNGLYRVNSRGLFNVPYGKYKNPAVFEESMLQQISAYLNSNDITITNTDFEDAVSTADEKSFIYFDPPYHSADKKNFTGYHAQGFGEDEQIRLRNVIIRMTERGVKCLLSNSDTGFVREIYTHKDFDVIPVQAKRAINSDAAGRGSVGEVLVRNWRSE
ncbi:site-specific DNA-methyltransferase (adenine-specific) [Spirochaetia bacterium]|nr:site-specific DNA-methyltransferase (adenine-specific) [Spirochaetia bacterium]